MSEVKRYIISGLHPHMYENKDGFMVYYEDYAGLKAEVERLKHELNYWQIEAECNHGRWLMCLEDLEKLRSKPSA